MMARSMWAFAGQAMSSASNVVLGLFLLSSATRQQFASFSICILSFQLIAQLCRSSFSLPVLILYSDNTGTAPIGAQRTVAGLVILTGTLAAVPLLGTGLAAGPGSSQFLVISVAVPFLLYQDFVRHVAFAGGQPMAAALSDGLWLTLQIIGCTLALLFGIRSPAALLAIWGAAGASAGFLLGARLRVLPRFAGMRSWLRSHRSLWMALLGEFVFISGSTYLVYYALGLLAGADELGKIRAAQTFIGPAVVALLGGAALGVPESVRLRAEPGRLRRFAFRLAAVLAAGSILTGAIAYWLLPLVGPQLFPHTWTGARPIVPVLSLFAAAVAVNTGLASALRALDAMRWITRTRAYTGGLAVALSVPASAVSGAKGAVGALALTEAVFAVLAVIQLQRATRVGSARTPASPTALR